MFGTVEYSVQCHRPGKIPNKKHETPEKGGRKLGSDSYNLAEMLVFMFQEVKDFEVSESAGNSQWDFHCRALDEFSNFIFSQQWFIIQFYKLVAKALVGNLPDSYLMNWEREYSPINLEKKIAIKIKILLIFLLLFNKKNNFNTSCLPTKCVAI